MDEPLAETQRLQTPEVNHIQPWKKWGPYLSERAWGSVREDYSPNGDAWNWLTHDMSRSQAYRWGEDGIGGWCDHNQLLCLSFAFWNEKDPILKERLFGLNPYEGNHGEDVKELYFYKEATPTYSYCKYLYKYPIEAYPYAQLVEENKRRGPQDPEFEILDTGIFQNNKYFDIQIEYAKAGPNDTIIRLQAKNCSNETAPLHIIPQLCFRNRWTWNGNDYPAPQIKLTKSRGDGYTFFADTSHIKPLAHLSYEYHLPAQFLFVEGNGTPLFTENETHCERIYGQPSRTPYVKDAFHRHIIDKEETCVNPNFYGSKAGVHLIYRIPPGGSITVRMRLSEENLAHPLQEIDQIVSLREEECHEYYHSLLPSKIPAEEKAIFRQAMAGMLWSKQFYFYDVRGWFKGDDPKNPPSTCRYNIRNSHWVHLYSCELFSMPDKWEYPWFAAWDLAFHTVALSLTDLSFAKKQLLTLLTDQFQHPNGQIPAYEWSFSDLNPPVQAWALWTLYGEEERQQGTGDRNFLKMGFLKLVRNFSWWVNKVDRYGNNFFEGGFLGLDNISIIDRSQPLKNGGHIEQSDGTGWMAFFALQMLRIALHLAKEDVVYESLAVYFYEHFAYTAGAIEGINGLSLEPGIDMWDEEDGFFYDVICMPDGAVQKLKIRSFVGIIPFFSIDSYSEKELAALPIFYERFCHFNKFHPKTYNRALTVFEKENEKHFFFSLMKPDQIKRLLARVWDTNEFRSPHGLRSLSKYHENDPLIFHDKRVQYEPGESFERIKGGNSNWRGPIWMPTNYLFIQALKRLDQAFGSTFYIDIGNNQQWTAKEMAHELSRNLISLFQKNEDGDRPIHNHMEIWKEDLWKDLVFFYEHYHGDTGRGLGASHQTGWSGLIANLIFNFHHGI